MRRPIRNIFLAASFLILSACASAPKQNVLVVPAAPPPPIAIPKADPVNMQSVQIKVYNSDELVKLAMGVEGNDQKVTIFAMDSDSFKHLDENLIDIKRYIAQQNEIIDFLTKALNERQTTNSTQGK